MLLFFFLHIILGYRSFSSSQEGAASVYTLADGGIGDWFGGFLYSSGQQANEAVQSQLSALSFTRFILYMLFPSLDC